MGNFWERLESDGGVERATDAAQRERHGQGISRDIEDVLADSRTGIWAIELEEGREPRMYADRTMRMLLDVSGDIGPEECYRSWLCGIEAGYEELVREALKDVVDTGRSEVVYPWNHPTLGRIYIRCGGVLDQNFKRPGTRLKGYHQDITETMVTRKKQEQAIMELLEKVRQANLVKNEFLSHMSHDLRTPINGILGMLTIMESCQDDPERQRDCREKIRVSTEHLLSLVNDALAVSKLESGQPVLMEAPFDLRDTLESCVTVLLPQAESACVRLTLEEPELRHSSLTGDQMHIKKLLMNIIDNAIKYNQPGGSVFIRVKETECRDGLAEYRFIIEDTGIGIGEDFKQHIFEPFAQEDRGARTEYGGVGLGLSIARQLVEQMNGSIEVESQQGRGSTFQVTLPIRIDGKEDAQPAGEERDVRDDISGMHVLLVEDNEINCEIVEFILKQAGASVETARDGKAAVDGFTASEPGTFDCILMDLMMPVMSGFEAARVIRSLDRPDARAVPIIALSANAFEEDVAMAKDAGMDEHLAKPVDVDKLFRAMCRSKMMEHRRPQG